MQIICAAVPPNAGPLRAKGGSTARESDLRADRYFRAAIYCDIGDFCPAKR